MRQVFPRTVTDPLPNGGTVCDPAPFASAHLIFAGFNSPLPAFIWLLRLTANTRLPIGQATAFF